MSTGASNGGTLAIVLHTHMPYVHGYGTWPMGEEWLWEVHATSYLPLAELTARTGAQLTWSITPVVADQLEAPGAAERCREFVDVVRRRTTGEDLHWMQQGDEPDLAEAARYAWSTYESALAALDAGGDDLLAPLRPHAAWTSAATHAVLPLLATEAGIRLQLGSGIASHRRRFGRWGGGLWLPECAWDPEIEPALIEEGVRTVCIEVADGPHAPWETAAGLRILPLDRPLIDAVWHESGYPSHAHYRDSHHTSWQGHQLWANDGAVYDPQRGRERAEADGRDWATRCAAACADGMPRVVAFDTELFGHWWHEGPWFLEAAIQALQELGVQLVSADAVADAGLQRGEAPAPSTWGRDRDLSTWSGPAVSTIAWELRRAELDLLSARLPHAVADADLRDLLALQSSDWAFMVAEDRTVGYAWQRFAEHRLATRQRAGSLPSSTPRLRHLAPDLAQDALAVG